jgi:hypothetical protein
MKLTICFAMLFTLAIGLAEDQTAKKDESAKKAPVVTGLTLPAGAKKVEPGTYTYTDAQGKKWIYRETPFGLAKMEDKPAPEAAAAPAGAVTKATEDGDTIRFERPGPFGVYRWQKKKKDLTDDEKAAWERSKDKSAATKAKQE